MTLSILRQNNEEMRGSCPCKQISDTVEKLKLKSMEVRKNVKWLSRCVSKIIINNPNECIDVQTNTKTVGQKNTGDCKVL